MHVRVCERDLVFANLTVDLWLLRFAICIMNILTPERRLKIVQFCFDNHGSVHKTIASINYSENDIMGTEDVILLWMRGLE